MAPKALVSNEYVPVGIALDATARPHLVDVTIDADFVYWTNQGTAAKSNQDSGILKAPRAGGSPSAVLGAVGGDVYGVRVDGSHLYFSRFSGTVSRLAK